MEENEEEEDDDSYPGYRFPEYDGTTMGEEAEPTVQEEAEEEASDESADDLGQAIADAKRKCAKEKERLKLQRMLEDHKKLFYQNCEANEIKLGTRLELLQWKA